MNRLRTAWLVIVTIGLAACASLTAQDTAPTTAPTTAAPTTVAVARADFPSSGPVEPGTYHIDSSAWSVAGFTMTLPEGWETQYGYSGAIKASGPDGEVGFNFEIVDEIWSDPCLGSDGGAANVMQFGPSVNDLANALLEQPNTVSTGPVDTTLGGLAATRIDLTMAEDSVTATCNINLPGHLQIWYSEPVDSHFVLLGDGTASVYILDVNGERQVFLSQYRDGTPADDISEMQAIIQSITIDS